MPAFDLTKTIEKGFKIPLGGARLKQKNHLQNELFFRVKDLIS